MDINPDIFGYLAAFFTTISFLPQVIKTIKTRDTRSISLLMYICFTFGVAMWLIFGLILSSPPMIIANILTLALALVILFYKIKEVINNNG